MDEEKFFIQEFKNLINLFNQDKKNLLRKLILILSNPLNTKGKSSKQEIEDITDIVNNYERHSEIKFNESISISCQKQLDIFINKYSHESEVNKTILKNFQEVNNIKTIRDTLEKSNIKEFSTFSQIQEADQTFEKVIAKLLLNYDKTNNFLSILNDPIVNYYGLSVKKFKNIFLLNVIFIDNYKSEESLLLLKSSNPLKIDNMLIDYINNIRTSPLDYLNDFNILKDNLLSDKEHISREKVKSFIDILKLNEPMQILNRKLLLDELAQKVLSKQQITKKAINNEIFFFDFDEKLMIEYCKNFIKSNENLQFIGCVSKYSQSPFEIINHLLFSDHTSTKKEIQLLFKDQNISSIGLSTEIKEEFIFILIILVNDANSITKIELSEVFIRELTKLRKNPLELIPEIEQMRRKYENIDRYSFLKDSIENLLEYLHHAKSLPEIEINEDLNMACKEYCNFLIDPKTNNQFYTEEDELLRLRLEDYVHGFKNTCQYVIYQDKDISEIIFNLLLEENVRINKKGVVFLGKNFKYYGIAERIIRGKSLIVLIFTDYIQRSSNVMERLKAQFLSNLNLVRRYPRAIIKYLYNFPENTSAIYDTYKNDKEKNELDKLADFLFNAKNIAALEEREKLTLVSEKYIMDIINKKSMLDESGKKDIEDCKNASSSSLNFSSVINEININHIELNDRILLNNENPDLLKIIFNKDLEIPLYLQNIGLNDFTNSKKGIIAILLNTTFREILFSAAYKIFGITINEKRRILYMILCDEIIQKIPLNEYYLPDKARFLRPNLNDDEENEIRNNFHKLDISNKGRIFPKFLIELMENNNLAEKNIIYYTALKLFLSESYKIASNQGIDIENFIDYCKKAITLLSLRENVILFNILKIKSKAKEINFEDFKKILIDQNYKFLESEAESIFENICYPDYTISQKKFLDTMEAIKKMRSGNQKDK